MLQFKNICYDIYVKCSTEFSLHKVVTLFLYTLILLGLFISITHLNTLYTKVSTTAQTSNIFFVMHQETESIEKEDEMEAHDYNRININSASREELMTLPHIGQKKAEDIIKRREASPFEETTDLMEVKGIGVKTFENLSHLVTVE